MAYTIIFQRCLQQPSLSYSRITKPLQVAVHRGWFVYIWVVLQSGYQLYFIFVITFKNIKITDSYNVYTL